MYKCYIIFSFIVIWKYFFYCFIRDYLKVFEISVLQKFFIGYSFWVVLIMLKYIFVLIVLILIFEGKKWSFVLRSKR